MTNRLLHPMDASWTSSDEMLLTASTLAVTVRGMELTANRWRIEAGASGVSASFTPIAPLDLSSFDELRLWIRAARRADGSTNAPYLLEFSYIDANDLVDESHAWLLPVNRANVWEQRKIGIAQERRTQITTLSFRCLTDTPFSCDVAQLLAVTEELMIDVESALATLLHEQVVLSGVTNLPVTSAANVNETQLTLPLTPTIGANNQIVIREGNATQVRQVMNAAHNGDTVLTVDTGFSSALTANVATVSVVAPLRFVTNSLLPSTTPAVIATLLSAREDQERTGYFTQRDSFRPNGAFSTRPAPLAYMIDYQLTPVAATRHHLLQLYSYLARQLNADRALPINGYPCPVQVLTPPEPDTERPIGVPASVYIRIGTRLEVAPRVEQFGTQRIAVGGAPLDAPQDVEHIELVFD